MATDTPANNMPPPPPPEGTAAAGARGVFDAGRLAALVDRDLTTFAARKMDEAQATHWRIDMAEVTSVDDGRPVRLLITRACAVAGEELKVGRVLRAAPPELAADLVAAGNAVDVSDEAVLAAELAKLHAAHDAAVAREAAEQPEATAPPARSLAEVREAALRPA